MSTPRVTVYTRRFCGYCTAALRLLRDEGVPFEHIDMSGDRAGMRELKARSGHHTMPQVFLDGELVGGYDELSRHIRRSGAESLM